MSFELLQEILMIIFLEFTFNNHLPGDIMEHDSIPQIVVGIKTV